MTRVGTFIGALLVVTAWPQFLGYVLAAWFVVFILWLLARAVNAALGGGRG